MKRVFAIFLLAVAVAVSPALAYADEPAPHTTVAWSTANGAFDGLLTAAPLRFSGAIIDLRSALYAITMTPDPTGAWTLLHLPATLVDESPTAPYTTFNAPRGASVTHIGDHPIRGGVRMSADPQKSLLSTFEGDDLDRVAQSQDEFDVTPMIDSPFEWDPSLTSLYLNVSF
ncbi:hypothetical protein K8I61_19700 [bacterium]|nr:hypothetical protein [bacterium]